MSKETDKTNLGYLGEDFQYKLVHVFFADKEFFKDLYEITDQNMFTNPFLKEFVGMMKEYYEKESSVPSYESINILLRNKSRNSVDLELKLAEIERISQIPSDDIAMIKELSTKFFRQQNIVKTANQILKIASNGVDEDKCTKYVELMSEAIAKGVHNNFGVTVTDDLEETLSMDYRKPIPTGVKIIDNILEGGIGKGELGVIACPTGIGKTSLTTAMSSYAAIEDNKKVLQIFFEDTEKQIRRKHIARFVTMYGDKNEDGSRIEVEARNLSKPEIIEYVRKIVKREDNKERYERLKNNIKLVRLPSGDYTAESIKRFIKKLIGIGFYPDLCVIDYFECINHDCFPNVTNDFDKEGKSMRKFEAMAGELNIAFWIPSQGTKDSINLELVTIDKMGGSAKKSQIAHIILSIAKTTEDIANNKATLAVLKNRAGQSGKIFEQVNFNNGTCVVEGDENSCDSSSLLTFSKKQENKMIAGIFKQAGN